MQQEIIVSYVWLNIYRIEYRFKSKLQIFMTCTSFFTDL